MAFPERVDLVEHSRSLVLAAEDAVKWPNVREPRLVSDTEHGRVAWPEAERQVTAMSLSAHRARRNSSHKRAARHR